MRIAKVYELGMERKIKRALAERHYQDFFQTEVKDGPTHGAHHLRLDGFAIAKSWVNPCFYGYEIKVSKSDFNQDAKWHGYLQYCHRFYFVTPKGLVDKKEVADPAGLIHYNEEKNTLRIVKHANHRVVEPDPLLLMYLIMNGAKTDRYPFFDGDEDEHLKASELFDSTREELFDCMGHSLRLELGTLRIKRDQLKRDTEREQEKLDKYGKFKDLLERKHLINSWGKNSPSTFLEEVLGSVGLKDVDEITAHMEAAKTSLFKAGLLVSKSLKD